MAGRTAVGPKDPAALPAAQVAADLGVDTDRGLAHADAAERLADHGPNRLEAPVRVPAWRRVLAQTNDPLVHLLLVAVGISTVAWIVEGARGWPVDAVVISVIVLANAVLGYVQDRRAEDAVAALEAMSAPTATVVRSGGAVRLPAADVVPGDVLLLAEGDTVPADARLVRTAALTVAEAVLTGESEPVAKRPEPVAPGSVLGDRTSMVFAGTAVTRGTGRAVVTSTGMGTETGAIARMLGTTPSAPTPLQREIAAVGRMLGRGVVVIALVVVVTVLLVSDLRTWTDAVTVLLLGVSLAVAAVPEGLPAILSVVLALGVQRMARRSAVVTRLSSVETLGSASVICSDKTGTLTQNRMTAVRAVTADDDVPLGAASERVPSSVGVLLAAAAYANDADLVMTDHGPEVRGDPTESALLLAARTARVLPPDRTAARLAEVPFSSERKLMSVVLDDGTGGATVVTKGAPDVLLARCTHEEVDGSPRALDGRRRAEITAGLDALADRALRTLAVARRPGRLSDSPEGPLLDGVPLDALADRPAVVEDGLCLLGVLGLLDPPREEAPAAVAAAQRAGIRVVMITGDHPGTARRIATDLAILRPEGLLLTGPDLDALDDDALRATARRADVYARVAPAHKLRIVDALQADGHVVAMTGDGVNDAPALRSADIGVAMGRTGTEVTRQAATMVLADDDFATIVAAVREGRVLFDNIRAFLRYLLSSNVGEVLTVFVGVLAAGFLGLSGHGEAVVVPLLATQILWINLLTDTAPALAMGVDPPSDDVMARAPRRPDQRVIDGRMWRGVALVGATMAFATLLTIDVHLPGGLVQGASDVDHARTAGFTTLVLAQLVNALCTRSETRSALRHLTANRWLWGALTLSLALQVAVVHLPFLNAAFGTVPMSAGEWAFSAAAASSVLVVSELRKAVLRRRDAPGPAAPSPARSNT